MTHVLTRMRPLLGTFVEIRAAHACLGCGTARRVRVESAIGAAFAAIERVQRLMSFHDPESDVSRINAAPAGEILRIDSQTHAVLSAARALSERTNGLFDVTVAPPLMRHDFLPVRARQTVDASYRDLELLPERCVRWRRPGSIDLGGIAKGYAVDCAIQVLRANGLADALVNAGGDLRCFGVSQPIDLRAPDDPRRLIRLGSLTDGALATSADYFIDRESRGARVGALVDPRRKDCIPFGCSVSVVAQTCMMADALTKVVAIAPEHAPEMLEDLHAAAGLAARAILWNSLGIRACGRQAALRFEAGMPLGCEMCGPQDMAA
jgi:FAD:protein FMN transferase